MTYKNCSGRCASSRWRLGICRHHRGERRPIPLFSLTYKTKAEAEEAHSLMAKVIEGVEITARP
jgi:hypothetical protein